MARDDWQEIYCSQCGTSIHYHISWSRIPDLCTVCLDLKKSEWQEKYCKECGTVIRYHVNWQNVPDLCKSCREHKKAQWQQKPCKECGASINYHLDWQNVPDICKSCLEKHKQAKAEARAKWKITRCNDCGCVVRYHLEWERIPTLCTACIEKRKAKNAEWKEKSCTQCHTTIKYHEDWNRVPDYCKDCNKLLTKRCEAEGCREEIRYKIYWQNIPEYCKPCKTGQRPLTEKRLRPDGGWDLYTGWGYVNKRGVIVFVDNGPHGKHSHAVYNAQGKLVGYRSEGYQEDWKDETRRQTRCHKCGDTFYYSVDRHDIPRVCRGCRTNEPRLKPHIEIGIHGESLAEKAAIEILGLEPTDYSRSKAQGFDFIFRDGENIVIVEAKSVSGYPPSTLGERIRDRRQMDFTVMVDDAKILASSDNHIDHVLGEEILSRINNKQINTIRRIIINSDPRDNHNQRFFEAVGEENRWIEIDPYDDYQFPD